MSAETTATITENELFENFLHTEMPYAYMGRRYSAKVRDHFTGLETSGLDEMFDRLFDECVDERQTNDPTTYINHAFHEIRYIADGLGRLIEAFELFKADHLVSDSDDDQEDGEGEDRYRVPVFESEAA